MNVFNTLFECTMRCWMACSFKKCMSDIYLHLPTLQAKQMRYYKSLSMSFEKYKTFCEKGAAHAGKEIIMICVTPECESKRLCCLTCIDDIHRKHQLISLYKFDNMLKVLTEHVQPDIKIAILSSLQQFETKLIKGLDRAADNFNNMLNKFKNQIRAVVAHIKESINLNFTPSDVEGLYSNFTNSKVCEYLDFIKQAENQNFRNIENTAKTLKLAETNFDKQLFESEKLFIKGGEDVSKAIQKLKQLIKSSGSAKKKLFNKALKAASIEISQAQDEAKRFEGAGGYPIAVIDEILNETNSSVNVLVKEQPGNKGVWMGVCVLDIVKTFNFASCYGIGKGTWAIDQVGASHQSAYSWSHHDSNFNSQPKVGFQFFTGDIVNIRVDFAKSTVIFTKESSSYEMPIKTDLGDLYFFVGPTHINDTIAIV